MYIVVLNRSYWFVYVGETSSSGLINVYDVCKRVPTLRKKLRDGWTNGCVRQLNGCMDEKFEGWCIRDVTIGIKSRDTSSINNKWSILQ